MPTHKAFEEKILLFHGKTCDDANSIDSIRLQKTFLKSELVHSQIERGNILFFSWKLFTEQLSTLLFPLIFLGNTYFYSLYKYDEFQRNLNDVYRF